MPDPSEFPELENGRLLQAIFTSSDEAILAKKLDGTITMWNPAAERLYGYTAEEAIGNNVNIIAVPGREFEIDRILERLARGQRISHFHTQRRRKDGSTVDIALTVSPIRDVDGNVVQASAIAHELTDAEIELIETRAIAVGQLRKTIDEQNAQLNKMVTALKGFAIEDVVVTRLHKVERRLLAFLVGGMVLVMALAGGFAYLGNRASKDLINRVNAEAIQRSADACNSRNTLYTVVRKITDRSQTASIDLTKLDADAKRVLTEIEAAMPAPSDPESFRNFVYSVTQPQDCKKLER